MISVKESVEQIKGQFLDLFGSDLTDIRLEEIHKSSAKAYYLTLSFLIPNKNMAPAAATTFGSMVHPYIRQYKDVVVNKIDGTIISVTMHKDG